ncbi:MAG TPA: hypothetical protein VNK24_09845, partial [Elusimicrobiota bacterium]|nr:hypothetical protein [Elusimicrobiota bacterium]
MIRGHGSCILRFFICEILAFNKSDMLIHLTPPNSREVACEASIGTIKSRDWGKNAPDGSRENGVTLGREF